jgi:large subunit ribosomal protein L24
MTSKKPRVQRRRAAEAALHERHRFLTARVDSALREKSKLRLPRAIPVRKGDVVRILRGGHHGKEGKILSVDQNTGRVVIEGITIERVDEKKVERPAHASNLLIVKMDDTDSWRRKRYGG